MNGVLIFAVGLVFPLVFAQDLGIGDEFDTESISSESEERIIGGTVAVDHSRPWMVYLYSNPADKPCGGALVAPKWVLTAAHCVSKPETKTITAVAGTNQWCVVIGNETKTDFGATAVQRKVIEVKDTARNNKILKSGLVLLKLEHPFPINANIKTIALTKKTYSAGEYLEMSGWGFTSYPSKSPACLLRSVQLPMVSSEVCKEKFPHLPNYRFCAGYKNGEKGICKGDYGGPLVDLNGDSATLVGILSQGKQNCNSYGVYINAPLFSDWIASTTIGYLPGSGSLIS